MIFPYRKALRTNLGKLNLIKELKKDNRVRHSFNCFAALAFLPVDDIKPLFDLMIAEKRFPKKLLDFANNYFRANWIEDENGDDGRYKMELWNVHLRYFLDSIIFLLNYIPNTIPLKLYYNYMSIHNNVKLYLDT